MAWKHTKRNAQRYEDHRYENVKTYIMPSPQHFAALVYGRSSGSGICTISAFPYISYSDIIDIAPPLQRRDRAGFAPASLLPQCYLSTSKHLFDLEWWIYYNIEKKVLSRGVTWNINFISTRADRTFDRVVRISTLWYNAKCCRLFPAGRRWFGGLNHFVCPFCRSKCNRVYLQMAGQWGLDSTA